MEKLNKEINECESLLKDDVKDLPFFSTVRNFIKETSKEKAQFIITVNKINFKTTGYTSAQLTGKNKDFLNISGRDFKNNRVIEHGIIIHIKNIFCFYFKRVK